MTSITPTIGGPAGDNDRRATIYIRNYAKKAIMLLLPARVKVAELKERIYRRMRVPHEDQILFLHGCQIGPDQEEIELENKFIFHLVNLQRTLLDKISISVKRIEPNSLIHRFAVTPTMKISEFMATSFSQIYGEADNYFLVYTGREIQNYSTFAAEFVEDQSEILAVHKIENLKGEFVDRKSEENGHKTHMFLKKESGAVEAQPEPPATATQPQKMPGEDQGEHAEPEEDEVNRSSKEIKEGEENKKEQHEQSFTEDIVIDYQQKYSVISKDSFCRENENVHKKLRTNYSSRPARQGDRRREQSSSPKLIEKIEAATPGETAKAQSSSEEEDEEEQRDYYANVHYTGSSNDKSEAYDRSIPLGLTVISSRHDEQDSLNEEFLKSGLAGRSQHHPREERSHSVFPFCDKSLEEEPSALNKQIEEGTDQSHKQVVRSETQKLEKSKVCRQEGRAQGDSTEEGKKREAEKSKEEEERKEKEEEYGRTNILEYIDDEEFLEKEDNEAAKGDLKNPTQQVELSNQETPVRSDVNPDISHNEPSHKEDTSHEDISMSKKKDRSKSAKSNHSESLLLENSQDVNEDNLFSGRFAWGGLKNDKVSIDLSAQLQEEASYNEIVPGSNAKNWDHLSFSFRNNQQELKAGDLIMVGEENALKMENLQDLISELFIEKVQAALQKQK